MSQLAMRRPDLAELPPLPLPTDLPDGYALRLCEKGECASLAAVLDLAFPGDDWDVAKTNKNLLEAEDVRATFVIEHDGKIVATASVQMPPGAVSGTGTVHWVGADPSQKGKRLGHLVTLAVLHRFIEEGCADANLSTDDARLPAIKTYLNLGFVPDYRDETHPLRWSRIFQALAAAPPR